MSYLIERKERNNSNNINTFTKQAKHKQLLSTSQAHPAVLTPLNQLPSVSQFSRQCHVVQKIPMGSLEQLSWSHPLPAPHWQCRTSWNILGSAQHCSATTQHQCVINTALLQKPKQSITADNTSQHKHMALRAVKNKETQPPFWREKNYLESDITELTALT